jgi:polysaccharide export outer membrane protein
MSVLPAPVLKLSSGLLCGCLCWLQGASLSALAAEPTSQPASLPPLVKTAPVAPPVILPKEGEYTLGPGDRFKVDVFQAPELSGEHQVLVDGSVGFPLIGVVKVQGKTIPELTQTLSQQYGRYVKRPVVTVYLTSPRPLNITLAGEINRPGAYNIAINQGQKFPYLTDIIQEAGGLTAVADISQVEVRRQTGKETEYYRVNLWELLQNGDKRQNITLRDGDVVRVPSKQQTDPEEVRQLADANFGIRFDQEINVAVVGEVFRPGSYKLTPASRASNIGEVGGAGGAASGSNASKTIPVRLTQALQEAGGIRPQADIRNVTVRRKNRAGQEELISINLWELINVGNLEKDIILQSGDIVSVPQATAISPKEFDALASANFSPRTIRVNVTGEVISPGLKEMPPNTTLNQAILAGGGFNPTRADEERVELVRLNPDGTVTKLAVKPDFGEGVSRENNPTLRDNDVVVVHTNTLTTTTQTIGTVLSPIGAILGGGLFSIINLFD